MALTSEDLNQIKTIVQSVVKDLPTRMEVQENLDRMETRLTTAIGLLQRDTFARLDQHEARIERLEKAIAK